MKTNMGTADRVIRLIIAAAIAVLYFTNQITGSLAILLLVIAAVLLVTSIVGVCPLYMAFHLNSNRKSQA